VRGFGARVWLGTRVWLVCLHSVLLFLNAASFLQIYAMEKPWRFSVWLLPTGKSEEHATFMSNEFLLFRPFSNISALSHVCLFVSKALLDRYHVRSCYAQAWILVLGAWCSSQQVRPCPPFIRKFFFLFVGLWGCLCLFWCVIN
jgi:hypothetical protein